MDSDKKEIIENDTLNCEEEKTDSLTVCDKQENYDQLKRSIIKGVFINSLALVSAFLLVCSVYLNYIMYAPKEKDFCDDNLFCGNNLSISEDVLDSVVSRLENELGVSIPEEFEDEYAVLDAVLTNDCLKDDEKEIFYRVIDVIKDNDYLNKEKAYRALRNVDVLHRRRPFTYNDNVQGVYSYVCGSIGIFEKDPDYLILLHEIIHCIYCNSDTDKLPTYFKEGMTELLVNEYFEDYIPYVELECYPFETTAIKMLCEVTSPDTVLKAFSYGDMEYIIQDIATITGNEDEARKALSSFEKILAKHSGDQDENDDVSFEQLAYMCIPVFRGIISAKYKETDDNRRSYFYNEILFSNIFEEDSYDRYIDDLKEYGYFHRAYFSSKLKQKLASDEINEKVSDSKVKTKDKNNVN